MELEKPEALVVKPLPFGLQIRQLRVDAGLTQDQLAARLGTTKATISKIERSMSRPKLDWIEKLADALDVDVGELAFDRSSNSGSLNMMPVIGMIAAGNWREAIRQSDEYVPVMNAKPHMFVLRVDGDSIDLIAPHGSFVSIDPTDPTLADGRLYAVQNRAGEATLKRFRRNPDRLEPESSNKEHRPILLGSEPITIVGRATSIIRMV